MMETNRTKGIFYVGRLFPNPQIWCNVKGKEGGLLIGNTSKKEVSQEESEANAAYMVKCLNEHDELVNVLKAYKNMVGNTGYTIAKEEAKYLFDIAEKLLKKVTDTNHSEV